MLVAHSELAKEIGIDPQNIFVLEDGDVLSISATNAELTGKVPATDVLIDGLQMWDLPTNVIQNRRTMGKHGVVLAVVTCFEENNFHPGVEIVSKGFIDVDDGSNEIIDAAKELLVESIRSLNLEDHDEVSLNRIIIEVLKPFFSKETKKRPMIVTTLVRH